MGRLIARGAEHAGLAAVREHPSELECLVSLAGQARAGDVVGLMTHQARRAERYGGSFSVMVVSLKGYAHFRRRHGRALADRLNAVEGILDDLKNGHIP